MPLERMEVSETGPTLPPMPEQIRKTAPPNEAAELARSEAEYQARINPTVNAAKRQLEQSSQKRALRGASLLEDIGLIDHARNQSPYSSEIPTPNASSEERALIEVQQDTRKIIPEEDQEQANQLQQILDQTPPELKDSQNSRNMAIPGGGAPPAPPPPDPIEARRQVINESVNQGYLDMQMAIESINRLPLSEDEKERQRQAITLPQFITKDFTRFMQDPAADMNRVMQEQIRQRGQQSQREPGPGEATFLARSQYGTDMPTPWPIEREESLAKMRRIVGDIENSTDPRGGDVNQLELQDLQLIMQHFAEITPRDLEKLPIEMRSEAAIEELHKLSQQMKEEFNARLAFHGAYLEFTHVGDVKSIHAIASRLRSNQLNTLFRLKDATTAFNYYEDKGEYGDGTRRERYINGTEDKKQEVRQEITVLMALRNGLITEEQNTRRIDLSQRPSNELSQEENHELSELNNKISQIAWAQRLGERIWEFTGRFAVHDGLRQADLTDPNKPPEFKNQDVGGGAFFMRRIIMYRDWLRTRSTNEKPVVELLDGVDLRAEDFMTSLPGQLETYWTNRIRQEKEELYKREYFQAHPNSSLEQANEHAGRKIKADATEATLGILGLTEKKVLERDENGRVVSDQHGNPKYKNEWPTSAELDLTKVKWEEIDFGGVFDSPQPLNYWAWYRLSEPENLRSAMVKDQDSLLRHPTPKAVVEIARGFNYLSAGMYKPQIRLVANFVKWRERQGFREKPIDVDILTSSIARNLNFDDENNRELNSLLKTKLEDYTELKKFMSYVPLDKFFLQFFVQLFLGVVQQGFSEGGRRG